jgi:opacity protein-like surface antigen
MNKSISSAIIVVVSAFSLQSQADENASSSRFYISGSYGQATSKTKPNYGGDYVNEKNPTKASVFGMGVGYKLNKNFRTELKYMHFGDSKYSADLSDGSGDFVTHKVNSKAFFANLYYDFNNFGEKLNPYVTSGIGYAKNKASAAGVYSSDGTATPSVYEGSSKGSLAWNVGAGLAYKISENVTWDAVQYSYFNLGKYSTKRLDTTTGPLKGSIKAHTITTGIRILL